MNNLKSSLDCQVKIIYILRKEFKLYQKYCLYFVSLIGFFLSNCKLQLQRNCLEKLWKIILEVSLTISFMFLKKRVIDFLEQVFVDRS